MGLAAPKAVIPTTMDPPPPRTLVTPVALGLFKVTPTQQVSKRVSSTHDQLSWPARTGLAKAETKRAMDDDSFMVVDSGLGKRLDSRYLDLLEMRIMASSV